MTTNVTTPRRPILRLKFSTAGLPGQEAMHREISELRDWKRRWMPASPQRGARLILHMLHYHDELVRNLGATPLRKLGFLAPLKELIAPYQPRDYRSIVAGG